MLRVLINFTPECVEFLAAAATTASKILLCTPKISFDFRPIKWCAILYFLRDHRLFCRFIFPCETISASAIFLWMKKAHRAKIIRIAKVFPCEVSFAQQKRLILKELRGRFSKRGLFGNEGQKPFVARRAPAPVTTANCGSSQTWVRISRFLAIYSGTKEIFATPPDRYTPF